MKSEREAPKEKTNLEIEKKMAKVIEGNMVIEKTALLEKKLPEELTRQERKLQVKTWLERGQAFLRENQFDEALLAAEQVFRLDPENPEASRLTDEIKGKARSQGREESLFLQDLYQQEVKARIEQYREEAEEHLRTDQLGAARLAIEKILLLEPKDAQAQKLLATLNKKEEAAWVSRIQDSPSGK